MKYMSPCTTKNNAPVQKKTSTGLPVPVLLQIGIWLRVTGSQSRTSGRVVPAMARYPDTGLMMLSARA